MSPATIAVTPDQPSKFNKAVSKSIFPDGIKTSGQHPPLYNELRTFNEFPSEINGPTVWHAEDYSDNPERWTHRFTHDELAELSHAADEFRAAGIPLTGISKVI